MKRFRRFRKFVKKGIREQADIFFDQTGLDVTQFANEPRRTILGEWIPTDTQLRFITEASRPIRRPIKNTQLETYNEKVAQAIRQMETIPDSILDTSGQRDSEETVQINQNEATYMEMSAIKTLAAAETVVG